MQHLPFTLRQLEVFASLCATRSFRRSAESLGISQASVSNQIKALEDQLGVILLARRAGKRPTLTADGMSFLEDLRAFQAAGDVLAAHRRRYAARDEPARFRIFAGQGLVDSFIRPKLDRFLAANPTVECEFVAQLPADRTVREIADGRYDFALFHLRADRPLDPTLRPLALVRGGIYGHRKFAEGRSLPLRPEDVSELPFILPQAGSPQEREVLETFARHRIRPRQVIGHTQFYDVITAMIERGLGVASYAEAMMSPAARAEVVLLYPLQNWRLVWYRKDQGPDARRDSLQAFLISSVLQDPNYPTVSVFEQA
jgi:DNA-binding transcriptional LysR family regulator